MQIDAPRRDAIHPRGAPDLGVYPAQRGQHHCHDQPCIAPYARGDDAVDGKVRVGDPGEAELLEPPAAHQLLDPEGRIKQPAPSEARDDEREGEGQQEKAAEGCLAPHARVERNRH